MEAWTKHPEAMIAYEMTAKADEPRRREPKMFKATLAEAELDKRARRLMKQSPEISYAKAVQAALDKDPSLYGKYEKELQAGATFEVPEPQELRMQPGEAERMYTEKSGTDDECPECDEPIDDDDKFCSACGADLSKRKSKRRVARSG